jgi:hypothetical protein
VTTKATVKRAKVSYWAGNVLVRVGDLLPPDDPKVAAVHTENYDVTTAV